jgi:hypothetical protein
MVTSLRKVFGLCSPNRIRFVMEYLQLIHRFVQKIGTQFHFKMSSGLETTVPEICLAGGKHNKMRFCGIQKMEKRHGKKGASKSFGNSYSMGIKMSPNTALNLAPFGRWTLRDKAAQRRLAHVKTLNHMLLARLFVLAAISTTSVLVKAETIVLSPSGYGFIQFGQSLKVAEANLNETALPNKRELGCDFVMFKKYPQIRFMVEDGILTRGDAKASVRNSAKVNVGMSLARVKALHPRIRIEPHKYDDNGHYLILDSADGSSAILFEEGGGKVTDIRAGKKPSVEYVEGCL